MKLKVLEELLYFICHLPLATLGVGHEPRQTFGVIQYCSPCFTGN